MESVTGEFCNKNKNFELFISSQSMDDQTFGNIFLSRLHINPQYVDFDGFCMVVDKQILWKGLYGGGLNLVTH